MKQCSCHDRCQVCGQTAAIIEDGHFLCVKCYRLSPLPARELAESRYFERLSSLQREPFTLDDVPVLRARRRKARTHKGADL